MKKKLMALFTAAVLATTVFAGCGDSSAETDTDVEATSSDEACSDETFSTLQDNYAAMVEAYNAVKELYESDAVEADADIEDVLNQAADIINEMGEITQDTITEGDAETLNSSMIDILDVLSAAVDAMSGTDTATDAADTTAEDASAEACSDETFATLQDTYATLTEFYNAVYEAYMSDAVEQDDTIETTLSGCEDVMTQMGEITQDTITESDAVALIDQMNAIADVLNVVVDAL